MNNIWILAQEGNENIITDQPMTEGDTGTIANGSNGGQQDPEPQKNQDPGLMKWVLPVMLIFMVVMMLRAPQKQKKERKKLEESLQKNDRILTVGGIYGTIVEIKEDEITLKVDESNNTKIKVTRSAIGRNVSKD